MKKDSFTTSVSRHSAQISVKLMFIFFIDRKGMLLVHKIPQGQKLNIDYYPKIN